MGILVDGEWRADTDALVDADSGSFERTPSVFRDWVSTDGKHPPAIDRYHLYISRACPWAHRTMLVRALKGLEDAISVDIVDPVRINDGWEFSPEKPDCTPDTVNGFSYLRDVYTKAEPTCSGRVTVPVLWDKKTETIVNNESSEIIQQLDQAFASYSTRDLSLYPAGYGVKEAIDEIYDPINNGVYRAGFAKAQGPYDEAVTELFDALDDWEVRLGKNRYVCGDRLTAADICLFTTLYRFDEIYHTHFKCNKRLLTSYPNLWGHTREIYQLPGVAQTCNMTHCKQHYYLSHQDINPAGLIPVGSDPAFDSPHGRESLPGEAPASVWRAE